MRGPRTRSQLGKPTPQLPNAAVSRVDSLPAPIGGWNTVSALANMPSRDCVQMINFWPDVATVDLRKGSSNHATGISGQVGTLMPFNGAATSLWAAVPSGIYDATASGTIGALGIACTNAYFDFVNFQNTGGQFIVAVNAVDKLKLYDGAVWADIDGVSVPAITGVATTDLNCVTSFKRRLWFGKKNSLDAYYLGLDAIAGALTLFPLGGLFSRGGAILAIDTWSIDGGNGIEDYLVFITDEGEAAVYQGFDPSSVSDFSLVGVFYLGSPVGPRCTTKFGGDLLYLSRQGVVPLSSVLQSTTLGRTEAISAKIQKAFSRSASLYGYQPNWQVINFSDENMLIVNVPVSSGAQIQYVMNTITRAWTSFVGWPANCFAVFNSQLYYGGNGYIARAWVGTSDLSIPITGLVQQSYNNFRLAGNKQITLTRLNVGTSANVSVQVGYYSDFAQNESISEVNIGQLGGALWDTALWDSASWGGDLAQLQTFWLHVNNKPAYFQSLLLRVQSGTATFTWTSTDFVIKQGGIL